MGGYLSDANAGFTETISNFNPKDDWSRVFLKSEKIIPVLYSNLSAVKIVSQATDNPVPYAIARIIKVAAMHRVTDTFGPIPYSQIGGESSSLAAAYDSQEAVYNAFFDELNTAISILNEHPNALLMPTADFIYSGNIKKWIKFANSLKLRLAIRIGYANPTKAQAMAEEAVNPQNGGVIESNADNAAWNNFTTTQNPIYVATRYNQVSKHDDGTACITGGDSHAAADIICYMNGYKDPRRAKYFTQGTTGTDENPVKGYNGLRIGITPGNKGKATTACSRMLIASTDPILWMNAAEVAFLRAEYELRWGDPVAAQSFYESGVKLSFAERGALDVDNYLADATSTPDAFNDPLSKNSTTMSPSTVKIAWKDDAGFDTNLERIITQKWIAIFPLGNEAWAEYRRTGYPRLLPVVDNKSGGTVDSKYGARRLPYPTQEYDENRANVVDAVAKLGGPDNCGTRVWWDFRTLN